MNNFLTSPKLHKFLLIYFWILTPLLVIGYLAEGFMVVWQVLLTDLSISLISLVGYACFIYKKGFLTPLFWKVVFFVIIIWALFYNLIFLQDKNNVAGYHFSPFWSILLILLGLLFMVPFYLALYLYAFKFQEVLKRVTVASKTTSKIASQPIALRLTSPRYKKIGWYLILIPLASIVISGMLWVMAVFISAAFLGGETAEVVKNVVNIIVGFIWAIGIAATAVCLPLGIIFIKRKEIPLDAPYDKRSGQGAASIIPSEIKGWNWGAAGLGLIWGLYHRVWFSLLVFIPGLNYIWWIVMGVKGNEWAWRKGKWQCPEEFMVAQCRWRFWGIGVFVLYLSLIILGAVLGKS